VPIFLLVPQVKLPKRLDLATPSRRSTRSGADRGELGGEEALNLVEACGSRVLRHLIDLPDQPSSVSHGVPALRQRPGGPPYVDLIMECGWMIPAQDKDQRQRRRFLPPDG
jgi:hypothetical protein